MKLLLDENLPNDLRHFLPGHEVFTVAYLGWKGVDNGALLSKAAEAGFDAVLTMDTGFPTQHDASTLPTAIVVIRVESNTLDALRPLVHLILKALDELKPCTIVRVPA